ncbi:MAG: heme A synthase [Alphaproteobacteria bacterium]|nr:heme A synthase [Alphaproteobacteria bacterium]
MTDPIAETSAAPPRRALPEGAAACDAVTVWLIVVIVMVFAMVVVGGVTRLTQSGLSIVDWNPIMGAIPPLSDAAWMDAFNAYKQFPEYQRINYGMTLAEFKAIFLIEYFHRLWGRLIGLAFALPLAWFVVRGRVRGALAWKLGGVLLLGGAQGLMGWIMVQSGLIDNPSVSAYRLTAHLMIAVAIYLILLWMVLGRMLTPSGATGLRRPALIALTLALVTVASGGFVAGLDAGMTYNTFPLMDGQLVPDGLLMLDPVWRNPFENVAMVQFDHRVLAVTSVFAVLWLGLRAARSMAAGRPRTAALASAAMVLLQGALGITTLVLVVPVSLGAAHQAGAMVLIALLTWTLFECRRSSQATA